jgi:hypothetical protein
MARLNNESLFMMLCCGANRSRVFTMLSVAKGRPASRSPNHSYKNPFAIMCLHGECGNKGDSAVGKLPARRTHEVGLGQPLLIEVSL